MTCSQHGKSSQISVYHLFPSSFEKLLQEVVVLYTNNGRHEDIYLVTVHLESIVTEKLGDTIVGFHDFGLGLFVAGDHYNGGVFSEHQFEVIDMLI